MSIPTDFEPSLHELLEDPVIQAVMRRDGLDRAALIAAIDEGRARLGLPSVVDDGSLPFQFEASVLAECRA
jgi:hypothetical protein